MSTNTARWLAALLIAVLAGTSCAGVFELVDPRYDSVGVITAAQVSPATVRAGQAVLLDYTLDIQKVKVPFGTTYNQGSMPPAFHSTRGETLVLSPALYVPGGALPTPEEVRAAEEPQLSELVGAAARSNGHLYALFVAPDTPGEITLTFNLGGGGGPGAERNVNRLTLNVLP